MKAQGLFFTLVLTSFVGCGFYQSKVHVEDAALTAGPLEATFQSIHDRIFVQKCLQCHSAGGKADEAPLDTYEETMSNIDYVIAGDPDNSDLVREIRKGKMPPKKSNLPQVTPEELDVIRQWIANGAKP